MKKLFFSGLTGIVLMVVLIYLWSLFIMRGWDANFYPQAFTLFFIGWIAVLVSYVIPCEARISGKVVACICGISAYNFAIAANACNVGITMFMAFFIAQAACLYYSTARAMKGTNSDYQWRVFRIIFFLIVIGMIIIGVLTEFYPF